MSVQKNFLIVKTSSLGDILQSFGALAYLRARHPDAAIDWVADERFVDLLSAHPFLRRSIFLDLQGLKKSWWRLSYWTRLIRAFSNLREVKYDAIFDLQGNSKSGLVTLCSRGVSKVGFGRNCVKEWPNLLATGIHFEVSKSLPMRLFYVKLLQNFFRDESPVQSEGVRFHLTQEEQRAVQDLLKTPNLGQRVMVCPGSRWINKQLPAALFAQFLLNIRSLKPSFFFLVWGTPQERLLCEEIKQTLGDQCHLVAPLSLPAWQNLMDACDFVLAVDSGALHLCATTATPSFSIFGPTASSVFKPDGVQHGSIQGVCLYRMVFEKQCPKLRSCQSGACIRMMDPELLFAKFTNWFRLLQQRR